MPKNIADHEGEQIIHKFDRFEKAKKPGIMTGTYGIESIRKSFFPLFIREGQVCYSQKREEKAINYQLLTTNY